MVRMGRVGDNLEKTTAEERFNVMKATSDIHFDCTACQLRHEGKPVAVTRDAKLCFSCFKDLVICTTCQSLVTIDDAVNVRGHFYCPSCYENKDLLHKL